MKIQTKTLELIAKYIGERLTGSQLLSFFEEQGINPKLIIYPNTKWKMIFDVLLYLSKSDNPNDSILLSRIITSLVHPLNLSGNEEASKIAINIFNNWLKYDNLHLSLTNKGVMLENLEDEQTNIDNTYKPSEPPPNIIYWRDLAIDLNQQTIIYDQGRSINEFNFETKPIKLLILLFDHPRVLSYLEIAKFLDLNCYHNDAENKDVAREVQLIKKELINILKEKVKLSENDLKEIIISKTKLGYKIGNE